MAKLNLVVIRSSNIERSMKFYAALGLQFEMQQHGSGPEHYAARLESCVFEIYPLSERNVPTTSTRLGFKVRNLAATLQAIGASSTANDRVVVSDPDGHRIELVQE